MEIGMDDPCELEGRVVTRIVRFNATVQGLVTSLTLGFFATATYKPPELSRRTARRS